MANQFLMWFTRFGSPHLVLQSTLEDCLDLARVLDDADTYVFDQYGVLNCVEQVGYAVIPDDVWDELFDKYCEEQAAIEAEEHAKRGPNPKYVGMIYVQPPNPESGKKRSFSKELYGRYTDASRMNEDYAMLAKGLGEDRVVLEVTTATTTTDDKETSE